MDSISLEELHSCVLQNDVAALQNSALDADTLEQLLRFAAANAKLPCLAVLMEQVNDPSLLSRAVVMAAKRQGEDALACVRMLLPFVTPQDCFSALKTAALSGNALMAQLLVEHSELSSPDPLLLAIDFGDQDVVEVLSAAYGVEGNSVALVAAAREGFVESLEILLPRADPLYRNSQALAAAAINGNDACVEVLYSISNPNAALESMKAYYPHQAEKWVALEERVERERLQRILSEETAEIFPLNRNAFPRKM